MRRLTAAIFTVIVLFATPVVANDEPLFRVPSGLVIDQVTQYLKTFDFKDRDRGEITCCVLGMLYDIEQVLPEAKIDETMISNYSLLCVVIDIRMKNEYFEELKDSQQSTEE